MVATVHNLALFAPEQLPAVKPLEKKPIAKAAHSVIRRPKAQPAVDLHSQYWLAIRFPDISIEALTWPVEPALRLVIAEQKGRWRIVACCNESAAEGVEVGMALSAAETLLPNDLKVQQQVQDIELEQQWLQRQAQQQLRWTDHVTVENSDTLLLNISGSLALFGGTQALLACIASSFEVTVACAVAPTAQAAQWLGLSLPDTESSSLLVALHELTSALNALPLSALALSPKLLEDCQRLGCHHLAHIIRLPKADFSRRFGPDFQRQIDRALGKLPDPKPRIAEPASWSADFDFDYEVLSTAQIEPVIHDLFEQLSLYLRQTNRVVNAIDIACFHRDAGATRIRLGLLAANNKPQQWRRLLTEHLQQLQLPEAVLNIEVKAFGLQTVVASNSDAFQNKASDASSQEVLSLLQVRLGRGNVRQLTVADSYYPESASVLIGGGEPLVKRNVLLKAVIPRPLALMAEAEPLGRFKLESRPEKITTAWWRDSPCQRTYFKARDAQQRPVWIYHQQGQWQLHAYWG